MFEKRTSFTHGLLAFQAFWGVLEFLTFWLFGPYNMHEVIELKYAALPQASIAEGTIYQRKDGRWAAKYAPATGGPTKYLYGKTKAEVARKLNQYKNLPGVFIRQDASSVPLADYVSHWFRLSQVPARKIHAHTYIPGQTGSFHQGDRNGNDC